MSRKKKQPSRKQRGGLNRRQRLAHARPEAKAIVRQAPANELSRGAQLLQQGAIREAQRCFEKAILVAPKDAVAHNCLGIVLRIQHHYAAAAASLNQAIRLRPEFPEAHNNLGNVLRDQQDFDDAEQCYRRAIHLNPRFAEAHCNLGVIFMTRGEIDRAAECYRTALAIRPNYVEALNNLGNACREFGDYDSALQHFHAALQLSPHSAEIHNNLATSLRDAGHNELAEQHCLEAIRLKPDFAEAHGNLGTIYVDRSEMQLAIESCERAVELAPDSAQLFNNLGNAYKHTRRFDKAMDAFRETARLQPNQPLYQLRTRALCPGIFEDLAQSEKIRRYVVDTWRRFAATDFFLDLKTMTWVTMEPGFNFQFMEANVRELKEAYAGIFQERLPKFSVQRRTGKPRVGIVVTRSHEGIFLRSLSNIIERFDAELCDLVILCAHGATGRIREGIHREVEVIGFPERFDHVVSVIQKAAVDVLYYWEIGTDTTNYFLPFLRLAPIQCTSWGIQVTSGISEVDYYLSNELVEPENAQEHYTETLRLGRTLLTYQTHPTVPANPKSREAFGFMPDDHVYVCAQQLGKFHPDFDPLIGGILRRDPQALFVLTEDMYGSYGDCLRARFAKTLPDVLSRIICLNYQEQHEYRSLLIAADVLLDPPHFGGVNSTYDGLSLGKPIVTQPSGFHRGRYAYGCYRKMEMFDCVAYTADEFVDIAIKLGTDKAYRESVEARLREASHVLFHDEGAVSEHERLFGELIEEARGI